MRRSLLFVLAVGLATSLAPATGTTVPLPTPIDYGLIRCTVPTPAGVHVPVVDTDDEVTLSIHVVLDRGFSQTRATQILNRMKPAYAPLHVAIAAAGFRSMTLSGSDSQGLIDQARERLGGARPAGSDVVLVLTPQNLTAPGLGDAVIGQADCIGGIRWPDRAFMVMEDLGDGDYGLGPIRFPGNVAAKTIAHELGHLLGAQHHFANCAEGIPSEVGTDRVEVSPCTLMFNSADLISINFGALEGAVVRAYAEQFARP